MRGMRSIYRILMGGMGQEGHPAWVAASPGEGIPRPRNQCLTWQRQGKGALIPKGALAEVNHEPRCVSVLNRPAQVIIPSWKRQIPCKRSHSTPERGKQRDATEVSDSRLYCSLTSAPIMHKDFLKRSRCLCKNEDNLLHKLHRKEVRA